MQLLGVIHTQVSTVTPWLCSLNQVNALHWQTETGLWWNHYLVHHWCSLGPYFMYLHLLDCNVHVCPPCLLSTAWLPFPLRFFCWQKQYWSVGWLQIVASGTVMVVTRGLFMGKANWQCLSCGQFTGLISRAAMGDIVPAAAALQQWVPKAICGSSLLCRANDGQRSRSWPQQLGSLMQ